MNLVHVAFRHLSNFWNDIPEFVETVRLRNISAKQSLILKWIYCICNGTVVPLTNTMPS